ncbi:NACHT and WD repeat domain-containing protein 2 [Anabrus simplex]|uniref:NACHT and WD repeat domain-containing protein 2 n=1 Tax=Anabrus simplex TaxID=316456 RepID=UPI0035A2F20D
MGSSCSSGQAHKDKDSVSTRSEESPSYQVTGKKQQAAQGNHNVSQQHSGVILEASTVAATVQRGKQGTGEGTEDASFTPATPSAVTLERKPTKDGLTKVLKGVAPSSISDSMSLSSPPGTSAQSPRDFDKLSESPLPSEVQHLPENCQHLLLGRIATVRTTTKTRKIVIYVCAADSQDCCVEKGALHNTVYPELRAYCRNRGYELHIVDLHWKTGLEKQQDHEFPELCLGELTRQMQVAYIIPVLFLNNSLGTPLLPNTIETQDFEMALGKADNKEMLQKWYRLDSHAQPPCYRLQPTGIHIPGLKENSAEEKERALLEWRAEIERTLAVMVNVFPQELRDTYLTTVVEQEVHNTVCMSQELARRCLWLYRLYTHTGQTAEPSSPGEVELARRLEALHKDLKNLLNEKHILRLPVRWVEGGVNMELTEHAQYITEVTAHLSKHLRSVIDAIIEEDQAKVVFRSYYGIEQWLLQELMQHASFCQKAAQCSVNREAVLQEIKNYVVGESAVPLVLHGPRGCGKSTLLSRAAQCLHTWLPDAALAVRFVGISAESRTTEQLLRSIIDQVSIITYGHQYWDTQNIQSFKEYFPTLLGASGIQRPQVIMIDGIDQVREYGTQTLDWLPTALPDNVKLVLSVAEDSSMFPLMLKKLGGAGNLIKMPDLGKPEAQTILMSSVMQYNHSVDSKVQDCVKSSVHDCTLPLYVKVLAWQTSWWSDIEHDVSPKGNVNDQLILMLNELEGILGKEMTEHALALATISKTGLTDSEMLDLLAQDKVFHSHATYVSWAPACLFWARLNKYLAPFLQWSASGDSSTLQWQDETLLAAIKQRYLGTQQQKHWASETLVSYFQGTWVQNRTGLSARIVVKPSIVDKCYDRRSLVELPYQKYQLHGSIKKDFLFNHTWLYEKLCGSNVHQVLEDIALEEKAAQDKDLALLKKCLEDSALALSYDGRQFYSHMYQNLAKVFAESSAGYTFMSKLFEICLNPPVPSLLPLAPLDGQEKAPEATPDSIRTTETDGEVFDQSRFNIVTRLGDNPDFVVTVSTEREEISVWDIHKATPVRTLLGVTHPINLKPIDEQRCVVLCRRELRIYDLNLGQFVTRLKGVMNQKMPYYGLHDNGHLVALSRNRMYVNLMNLESGDCVTTFKAGEDRFLNSLLVSGDGRVLVCGDETQKPFPLLVWNLASRKLLYDLRIPHHDFVTSLAAITHEGHYVCCVAKEVDEPCPNFIVVYDLQSGTLFKKWKPGVNTVSLDISSKDGCVLSGLEDARILVWDLITGNCRWSLCGHTAPVNFLRLDPLGGSFMSADSNCRDRSLRLWNLNKGELLAVYTPNRPVTCCEVTSGGRSVVLALRGRSHITTLEMRGPGFEPATVVPCYGHEENTGKTFDLRDEIGVER